MRGCHSTLIDAVELRAVKSAIFMVAETENYARTPKMSARRGMMPVRQRRAFADVAAAMVIEDAMQKRGDEDALYPTTRVQRCVR